MSPFLHCLTVQPTLGYHLFIVLPAILSFHIPHCSLWTHRGFFLFILSSRLSGIFVCSSLMSFMVDFSASSDQLSWTVGWGTSTSEGSLSDHPLDITGTKEQTSENLSIIPAYRTGKGFGPGEDWNECVKSDGNICQDKVSGKEKHAAGQGDEAQSSGQCWQGWEEEEISKWQEQGGGGQRQ